MKSRLWFGLRTGPVCLAFFLSLLVTVGAAAEPADLMLWYDKRRPEGPSRGDDGNGWSLAWKINFWARLRDGDHACKLMGNQLRYTENLKTVMQHAGGTYPNLFDAHLPFQIDGNFGFVSGVNEMLLQSHKRYTDPAAPAQDRYCIDLLPALPKAWLAGSIVGLRARGGFTVDLSWGEGILQAARLSNPGGSPAVGRVRDGGRVIELTLQPGESRVIQK